MSEKLTEWFESSVKPTIEGWYERDYGSYAVSRNHDYWDGTNWLYGVGSKKPTNVVANFRRKWRGLAENPEK